MQSLSSLTPIVDNIFDKYNNKNLVPIRSLSDHDIIKEIEEDEVRDISLYEEPVKYDPVEIDLVDVKTDKVIGETYERLAFKRVMKNRESRLYANKIDYLMDTNDASNVFSGHNKYQTILFIGIIIFVIILIVCLFGKFWV